MRLVLVVTGTFLALLCAPLADAATKPTLKRFTSCTSLLSYARANAEKVMGPGRRSGAGAIGEIETASPAPAAAPQSEQQAATGGGGNAFSQTNVQEAGVDEPDIVKTDGRRVFTVHGMRLFALSADGKEILGSVALPRGGEHRLFLHRDKVLVFSSGYVYDDLPRPVPAPSPDGPVASSASVTPYYGGRTTMTLVDVADAAAMRVTRTLVAEGQFIDARLTESTARIVLRTSPRALQEPTPEAVARARSARWLPRGTLRRGMKGKRTFMRLADCDDVRRPPEFSGLDALTILTIDVERGLSPVDSDAVLTSADTVYASKDSLYLASQRWGQAQTTLLHKLDISRPDTTTYRASGEVEGGLLNQFSLSEHAGVLRVATTAQDRDVSESFVTTLAERDGRLARVGKVGGLGKSERIYSVRFIGDQGYVVTFRETDPLYTLDLSNPAAPRVVGELKILGYSAYLHPVGEDLLLGVGQDATEEGMRQGTQLSLFDVSNPANPVRLHQRKLGTRGSSSEAEYQHHAFLWWPDTSLAVLPVYAEGFSGAIGLRVTRGGIDEVGRVTHGAAESAAPVQRSLVVGERLLTLSPAGLKASRLDTLADLAFVAFPH
jgi:hypothetical protein